jgi:hypothetical protein
MPRLCSYLYVPNIWRSRLRINAYLIERSCVKSDEKPNTNILNAVLLTAVPQLKQELIFLLFHLSNVNHNQARRHISVSI